MAAFQHSQQISWPALPSRRQHLQQWQICSFQVSLNTMNHTSFSNFKTEGGNHVNNTPSLFLVLILLTFKIGTHKEKHINFDITRDEKNGQSTATWFANLQFCWTFTPRTLLLQKANAKKGSILSSSYNGNWTVINWFCFTFMLTWHLPQTFLETYILKIIWKRAKNVCNNMLKISCNQY